MRAFRCHPGPPRAPGRASGRRWQRGGVYGGGRGPSRCVRAESSTCLLKRNSPRFAASISSRSGPVACSASVGTKSPVAAAENAVGGWRQMGNIGWPRAIRKGGRKVQSTGKHAARDAPRVAGRANRLRRMPRHAARRKRAISYFLLREEIMRFCEMRENGMTTKNQSPTRMPQLSARPKIHPATFLKII